MASANFGVTISEVTKAAQTIQQAAQDFLDTANNVFSTAENLASYWEGDSQVAFAQEQQQANQWYKKMVDIVNSFVTSLNTTAKNYQEADDQASAAVKSK